MALKDGRISTLFGGKPLPYTKTIYPRIFDLLCPH
jgi:hypothetical protein